MTLQIMVPDLPESVSDATVGTWHKKNWRKIKASELLVDLRQTKLYWKCRHPQDGVISQQFLFETGSTVQGISS